MFTFLECFRVQDIFRMLYITEEHFSFEDLVQHLAPPPGEAGINHLEDLDELRHQLDLFLHKTMISVKVLLIIGTTTLLLPQPCRD